MAGNARILAFAGSLRQDSYNKRLVRIAAAGARSAGAEVTEVDLKDHPLPVFDEDFEAAEGLHPNARALKGLFHAHQAFLIASPEYNSSITAVLKNTLDWVSRPEAGTPPFAPFKGKFAAIMAASPGTLGGLRGLVHIRAILGNIGITVLADQVALVKAHEAFNADGTLKDTRQQRSVEALGETLARLVVATSSLG